MKKIILCLMFIPVFSGCGAAFFIMGAVHTAASIADCEMNHKETHTCPSEIIEGGQEQKENGTATD